MAKSNRGYPPVTMWRWDLYQDPPQWVKYTGSVNEKGIVQVQLTNGENDLGVDSSTRSLQVIDYEHHEIHSGSHYTVHGFLNIPALNDVLDFTWQMPNTTKWTHWNWAIETSKGVTWYIYEGAVATNALANTITPINSNRNSTNTSDTTMKYELQADLTAANADTDVSGATLIASGITGDNRTAGDANRSNEFILKQGKMYCLRAIATAASDVNFDMQWYEHIDKH